MAKQSPKVRIRTRRMFSTDVVDLDAFIEMSLMARLLYYEIGLNADDDGFVDSHKKAMRIIGAHESDLEELINNGFIHKFDSGVLVIRHWNVNNTIRSDIYKETTYKDEKAMLLLDEYNVYQLRNENVTSTLQERNDNVPLSKEKISKEKKSKEKRYIDADINTDEGVACVHESPSENQAESGQPSQESPIVYFPTKFGEQPIYQSDIDDLSKLFNGSVDVRNEILSCMAYYSDKPEAVSTWQSAVKVWINRTINFNNSTKFAIEQGMAKNGGRNHRSMEPDKYIVTEDAGL